MRAEKPFSATHCLCGEELRVLATDCEELPESLRGFSQLKPIGEEVRGLQPYPKPVGDFLLLLALSGLNARIGGNALGAQLSFFGYLRTTFTKNGMLELDFTDL